MVIVATTILVVDDDRAIRESVARALRLEGYDVTVAVDGVEAIVKARSPGVDVVVLDVMMPGVDGVGVCRVLRAEGVRTPILMLTARVEVGARVAGLDAGADDYLAKPFELDELLARLRALLRRSQQPSTKEPEASGFMLDKLRLVPTSRQVWWGTPSSACPRRSSTCSNYCYGTAGRC